MIKAVLFDFGGTLDTNGIHWSEKFWEVYERLEIPVTKKQFEVSYIYSESKLQAIVKPHDSLETILNYQIMYQLCRLTNENLIPDQERLELIQKISRECYNNVKETVWYSTKILRELKEEYLLGVVSNYYGNLESVMKELKLIDYLDVIIDSEIVGVKKPDSRIFQIACEKINIPVSDVLVVGDSYERDIQPAKKIGCLTMWLDGTSWSRPSVTTDADYTIKSLNEIIKYLQNIN